MSNLGFIWVLQRIQELHAKRMPKSLQSLLKKIKERYQTHLRHSSILVKLIVHTCTFFPQNIFNEPKYHLKSYFYTPISKLLLVLDDLVYENINLKKFRGVCNAGNG